MKIMSLKEATKFVETHRKLCLLLVHALSCCSNFETAPAPFKGLGTTTKIEDLKPASVVVLLWYLSWTTKYCDETVRDFNGHMHATRQMYKEMKITRPGTRDLSVKNDLAKFPLPGISMSSILCLYQRSNDVVIKYPAVSLKSQSGMERVPESTELNAMIDDQSTVKSKSDSAAKKPSPQLRLVETSPSNPTLSLSNADNIQTLNDQWRARFGGSKMFRVNYNDKVPNGGKK
jgi:hypothetical protein